MPAVLTQRCDPFGAESRIQLAGGLFPENQVGKIMWHCSEPAQARYRMVCRGGEYGFTRSPGQGIIAAYTCPGGHRGQVMPLCVKHAREFTVGPPKPGWNRDKTIPHGQVGGTVANELCPACAAPPVARPLMAKADELNQRIATYKALGLDFAPECRALEAEQDDVRRQIDELHERGLIHKCPLQLVEVS